ncbi:MAG: thermonuclease family protein [Demequinaceae bacterium]|nr:thermonuclease family protein [Demequinaceae bacterium]
MSTSARRLLPPFLLIAAIVVWWFWLADSSGEISESPNASPTEGVAGEEWFVEHVIDGDTVVASHGGVEETVRFIGIDTPERDECGYGEAREELARMVDGRTVTLVPGAETDRDDYGRLLRYVEVDGVDVGLRLIENGYAAEVFDYRTGQPHDREDEYIAADSASPDLCPGWG